MLIHWGQHGVNKMMGTECELIMNMIGLYHNCVAEILIITILLGLDTMFRIYFWKGVDWRSLRGRDFGCCPWNLWHRSSAHDMYALKSEASNTSPTFRRRYYIPHQTTFIEATGLKKVWKRYLCWNYNVIWYSYGKIISTRDKLWHSMRQYVDISTPIQNGTSVLRCPFQTNLFILLNGNTWICENIPWVQWTMWHHLFR